MKNLKLMVRKLNCCTIAVAEANLRNYDIMEAENFDAKKDFPNTTELDLISYDTFDKALHVFSVICENRYIAAYILRLMRADVKSSYMCLLEDSELMKLAKGTNYYEVINWKAKNGVYILSELNDTKNFFNKADYHILNNF